MFAWPFRHVHLDGLAGRVEYAQLLNDASEIKMMVVDSHQQAQNTTMAGLADGTLTLELPIQPPAVAVPVIELFLKEG
jgi:alpha-L-fucosidase